MSLLQTLTRAVRWRAFRLFERVSEVRSPSPRADFSTVPSGLRDALWVFVATLGELAMIEPFLRRLVAEAGPRPLVLISDRTVYRASYAQRYPEAIIVEMPGAGDDYRLLAQRIPPALFVIAEIPARPGDAPCRFPVGAVVHARAAGARVALVNGWLYGYPPSCRLDAVERGLLARDYLQLFELITTHDDEVRNQLISEGADPQRIMVAGNFKFDSVELITSPNRKQASPALLASLRASPRPPIVAGSVERAEQDCVLDAFTHVRAKRPEARLVLVPRHPENEERMRELAATLDSKGWKWVARSRIADTALPEDVDCLLLDTFGELRDFYAAAAVTHVGRDHNVLEPLAFGRPVSVSPDWTRTYPSFPVYRATKTADVIHEATDAEALARIWLGLLDGDAGKLEQDRILALLSHARGATERTLSLFRNAGLLPLRSVSGLGT
jgi:3-deoxy-D-manno-octulosonic-acid transferase